jgi:hypothetical protein
MSVRYFVNQDSQGQAQAQDYGHETLAVIDIIKRVYTAFHHHQNLYTIIANLVKRKAMTDLIVITEWGLGVMELKHDAGPISMRGTEWYAGSKPIPGNLDLGYRNPHEQVQLYAGATRYQLMDIQDSRSFPEIRESSTPWLPGKPADWEQFQFGTAVCFTNKAVTFERFPFWHYKKSSRNPHIKAWEQFSILKPAEIPGWVAALHFEFNKRHRREVVPCHLTPEQTIRIVTELFKATEWIEIDKLMAEAVHD